MREPVTSRTRGPPCCLAFLLVSVLGSACSSGPRPVLTRFRGESSTSLLYEDVATVSLAVPAGDRLPAPGKAPPANVPELDELVRRAGAEEGTLLMVIPLCPDSGATKDSARQCRRAAAKVQRYVTEQRGLPAQRIIVRPPVGMEEAAALPMGTIQLRLLRRKASSPAPAPGEPPPQQKDSATIPTPRRAQQP
jgi:hypothetical protein